MRREGSLLILVQKCLLAFWQQIWPEIPPLFILPIKMLGLQALAFRKSVKLNSRKSHPEIKFTTVMSKEKTNLISSLPYNFFLYVFD